MKYWFTFIFLIVLKLSLSQKEDALIPVPINGKYGYINQKGQIVIEPQFLSAGEFHSGLACVRKFGTFGFINTKGDLVIPYQFDRETTFNGSYASVQQNGKQYIIAKKGKIIFHDAKYDRIDPLAQPNFFKVTTKFSKKEGVIDFKGNLMVDTIHDYIHNFSHNRLMITNYNENSDADENSSVINLKGKIMGGLSNLKNLLFYENNLFQHTNTEFDTIKCFNIKGKMLHKTIYNSKKINVETFPKHGFMVISYHYLEDNTWFGIMDLNQKILFKDSSLIDLTIINSRLLIGQKKDSSYVVLKSNGNSHSINPIENFFPLDDFLIYSEKTDIQGLILINGQTFLLFENGKLKNVNIDFPSHTIKRLTSQGVFYQPNKENEKYKFYSFRKHVSFDNEYDASYFIKNGDTFLSFANDSIIILDRNHSEITTYSKESKKSHNYTVKRYNAKYIKNRAYWNNLSVIEKKEHYDDYIISDPIDSTTAIQTSDFKLYLDSSKIKIDEFGRTYHTLQIINSSSESVSLSVIDGRLNLNIEAIDLFGIWQIISLPYPPSCGNSYRQSELPSGEKYDLSIPVYEGEIKTKIRAAIKIYDDNTNKTEIVYSNEIDGYVNPGQFYNSPDNWSYMYDLE